MSSINALRNAIGRHLESFQKSRESAQGMQLEFDGQTQILLERLIAHLAPLMTEQVDQIALVALELTDSVHHLATIAEVDVNGRVLKISLGRKSIPFIPSLSEDHKFFSYISAGLIFQTDVVYNWVIKKPGHNGKWEINDDNVGRFLLEAFESL